MKIVVHIHGGVLQEVFTDHNDPIEFILIDDDNLAAEGLSDEEQTTLLDTVIAGLHRSIF